MNTKNIDLKTFVKSIQPGDIIFSRSDTILGKVIQFSGHCMWNHVAMCISIKNKKYWCESTNSEDGKDGVKIWEMESGLRKYYKSNTDKFLFGVSKFNGKNINHTLYKFYKREEGKRYKKNYITLFFSWFDGFSSLKSLFCCKPIDPNIEDQEKINQPLWALNKRDTTKYFCSELLIQCLMDCNIMKPQFHIITKEQIPSSEWTVANMANTYYLNKNLNKGYTYSQIIMYCVIY
jgi:hypothetical protein